VNKQRTIKENLCALFVGLIVCLGVLYFFKHKVRPYDKLTPEEQRRIHAESAILSAESVVSFIKVQKALADREAGYITPEASKQIVKEYTQHGRAVSKRFNALKAPRLASEEDSEVYRKADAELGAINSETVALANESKNAFNDLRAGRITFEESEKVFADIDKRLKALEERLKALPMPPLPKQEQGGIRR
jgi:hypothetical protein